MYGCTIRFMCFFDFPLFFFLSPGGFRVKHVGIEWKCSSALPDTGVMDISFSWKLLICMRNSARKLDLLDMPQSFM